MPTAALPNHTDLSSDNVVALIQELLRQPLLRLKEIDRLLMTYKAPALADEENNHIMERYLAIMSPMNRMPDDILREVFLSCLPDDRYATMSSTEAPLVLTQVTSRWRSVAFSTPRLWNSLHVVIPSSTPVYAAVYDPKTGARLSVMEKTCMRADALKNWLKRSGSLPLDISLHEEDVYPKSQFATFIIQELLPYAPRWRTLKVRAPSSSIEDIKGLLPVDTPLLQSVTVQPYRDKPVTPQNWGNGALFGAQNVTDVSVLGIKGVPSLPVKWSTLTKLDLDAEWWDLQEIVTMSDVLNILERCIQLKTCRLKINCDGTQQPMDTPVSLPKLEEMYLLEVGRNPSYATLFNAPFLSKVEYYTSSMKIQNGTKVQQFLSTPGLELKELILSPQTCGGDFVADWLSHCPYLVKLTVTKPPAGGSINSSYSKPTAVNNALLQQFAPPLTSNEDQCICPRLETVDFAADAHFSEDALIEFVKRKMSGHYLSISKLKAVRVAFMRSPPAGNPNYVASALSNIATPESGLKIVILYPPPSYRGPFSPFEGIPRKNRNDPY